MNRDDHINYHSTRAARELDLALTAACSEAARAHFSLASLHMDRVRALNDRAAKPLLAM